MQRHSNNATNAGGRRHGAPQNTIIRFTVTIAWRDDGGDRIVEPDQGILWRSIKSHRAWVEQKRRDSGKYGMPP